MSTSYTYADTQSTVFTVTHARHMSAKVAADLKRIQRLYPGSGPTDLQISQYEAELTAMLKAGYVEKVTYGFQRERQWIEPTVSYTARELAAGAAGIDDDPGRIAPGKDISGADFRSYMIYTPAWGRLTLAEQTAFEATLPFARTSAAEPGVQGYLVQDRSYSSGGRALTRHSVKSF